MDDCIGDVPVNLYAQSRLEKERKQTLVQNTKVNGDFVAKKRSLSASKPSPGKGSLSPVKNAKVEKFDSQKAQTIAKSAQTLAQLRASLEALENCPFKETATRLVFSDGSSKSPLMIIGEGPGREEDLQGKPFVGQSGLLLNMMLASIGLDRKDVYIANIVPWRPPANKTPSPMEINFFMPFVARHIALVRPAVLLLLGKVAAQGVLATQDGIMKIRGQWQVYDKESLAIPTLATFHPAFLLRQPLQKRPAWKDFLAVQTKLASSQQGE